MAAVPHQKKGGDSITEVQALQEQGAAIRALGSQKAWPFLTGNPLVAFNTGLVGLVSNSFFRRMLMVRHGLILTSLPMAAIPGITVTLLYPALISAPILMGDIQCPLCASLRAGVMGLTIGALYPFLMAIPLNSSLAVRYDTLKIPSFPKDKSSFDKALQFWQRKIRYFKGQFISVAIFQTFMFAFVADRQFKLAHSELDVQYVRTSRWNIWTLRMIWCTINHDWRKRWMTASDAQDAQSLVIKSVNKYVCGYMVLKECERKFVWSLQAHWHFA